MEMTGAKTYTYSAVPEKNADKPALKTVKFWQAVSVVLFFACIALAVALGAFVASVNGGERSQHVTPCPAGLAVEPMNEDDPGLYDDLSLAEHNAVRVYMESQETLALTPWDDAGFSDNFINAIELHVPAKSEALAFLDGGGDKPERQALVTVHAGGKTPPVVEEYVVGPLPNPARHTPYSPPGRKSPIPWTSRAPDEKEWPLLYTLIDDATAALHNILKESFGYTYRNCSNRCLVDIEVVPKGYKSGERRSWIMFHPARTGLIGNYLNFMIQITHESVDPSEWHVSKVYYNKQYFGSVQQLITGYADGSVEKDTPDPDIQDEEIMYPTFVRRGKPQPASPSRGPTLTEPGGRRYAVRGRHVEYMGWSFDWRLSTSQSMQLYDIRMNGERIAYELSSQEATSFYSGYNPGMLNNLFVDSYFVSGRSFELVRGIDCPETATFFNTLQQRSTKEPRLTRNAVCVFELNAGIPLRRHFDSDFAGGFNFYGGMADHVLVLRHINTVDNYDYVYDYIFHQNGVMEVRVVLTGYILTSPDKASYGYPLYGGNVGNVHQHAFNYKVDLDILGTQNRFETVDIVLENITNPERPDLRHIQTRIQRNLRRTEREAAVQYDFNRPKYYNFYSEEETNRFGVNRGYRVQLNGIAKTLLPRQDWAPMRGVAWQDYQLAVTRRKESEPASSSIYNQNDLYEALVDFQTFIDDDENIVDEDLVAWVTLSTHHIPHSEDFPTTATAGTQMQFFLRPFNYYDEDPSVGSSNAVLITPGEKSGSVRVERFGTPTGPACVSEQSPFRYNGTWLGPH
ncbi:diamine oxidase [copper-containing]-like [Branchiostoma lanceolatum]|uniref:diamine oxidase [copper-containing]-like n=1 Tax=Branchiostoma lanceolatum TaxID=7740 RepID=UPI0034550C51